MREHARMEMEYWRYVSLCSELKGGALHDALSHGGTQEEINKALSKACANVHM